MDHSSNDNSLEDPPKWFPGTPDEEKRLRKWIKETGGPFWLENVQRWMWKNVNTIFDDSIDSLAAQYVLDYLAGEFQKVLIPHLASRLSNLNIIENFSHGYYQAPRLWVSSR